MKKILRRLFFPAIFIIHAGQCNQLPDSYQYVRYSAGKLYVFSHYISEGTPKYAQYPVMESSDGITWTGHTVFKVPSYPREIVYDSLHSLWFGVSTDSILTSPDALTWVANKTDGFGVCGLTYDSYWNTAIVSANSFPGSPFSVSLITSSDGGVTWQDHNNLFATSSLPIPPQMCTMQADGMGNTIGLEIPDNSTTAYVNRSIDGGTTWTNISTFPCDTCLSAATKAPYLFDVASDGQGTWVAVGGSGKVFVSADNGITWVSKKSNVTDDLVGVAANGSGSWIVTGTNIGGILLSTDNGDTWTLQMVDSNLKSTLDVTYAFNKWVVVGFPSLELFKDFNAVYYSLDGKSWTVAKKNK